MKDCLVLGLPGGREDLADTIAAVVVLREALAPELLKTFVLRNLPAWQVPREWRFVAELRVSQRGKLSRQEWRAAFRTFKSE